MRAGIGRPARWAAVACAYLGLWFLLTDTLSVAELLAGAATAALATAATAAVAPDLRLRPPRPAARTLLWLPWGVLHDTGLLCAALAGHVLGVRPVRGAVETEPFRARAFDARTSGRRAAATLHRSVTPNTVVLGFDREADVLVLHRLVPPRAAGGRR